MAKIENLKAVQAVLRAKAANTKNVKVTVGYTQEYAVYVHENLEAFHPVGQAKYLEQPARELKADMANIVKKAMEAGKTLEQSLMLAGLYLQAASQKLVPVDTGALRESAFTRVVSS